ncbi:MAG: hypothetical protein QOE96_802 [Blastocatellia bacterium]|jgi:hypothetical protein|nr:hypothetical protein [Blastocatellia bacterium]
MSGESNVKNIKQPQKSTKGTRAEIRVVPFLPYGG